MVNLINDNIFIIEFYNLYMFNFKLPFLVMFLSYLLITNMFPVALYLALPKSYPVFGFFLLTKRNKTNRNRPKRKGIEQSYLLFYLGY